AGWGVGETGCDAGSLDPLGDLLEESPRPEALDEFVWSDRRLPAGSVAAAVCEVPGDLPADRGDLAIELADARLARVATDDGAKRLARDRQILLAKAIRAALLRDEVPLRDMDLLVLRVARDRERLHAIAEGRRDRIEGVGGRDEQDL